MAFIVCTDSDLLRNFTAKHFNYPLWWRVSSASSGIASAGVSEAQGPPAGEDVVPPTPWLPVARRRLGVTSHGRGVRAPSACPKRCRRHFDLRVICNPLCLPRLVPSSKVCALAVQRDADRSANRSAVSFERRKQDCLRASKQFETIGRLIGYSSFTHFRCWAKRPHSPGSPLRGNSLSCNCPDPGRDHLRSPLIVSVGALCHIIAHQLLFVMRPALHHRGSFGRSRRVKPRRMPNACSAPNMIVSGPSASSRCCLARRKARARSRSFVLKISELIPSP